MCRSFWYVILLFSCGCSGELLRIQADAEAEVSLVEYGNLTGSGEVLGKTPLEIEMDKVTGKVVRIAAPGKVPYFWTNSNLSGAKVELKFGMQDLPKSENKDYLIEIGKRNRVQRLVFEAYRAVLEKDNDLAISLATEASKIDGLLAMPWVVAAMAHINKGESSQAKAALTKASRVDPEDDEIAKLIKYLQ